MALVGEIITKIDVDASKLQPKLNKAQKGFMKFSKAAKSALKVLTVGVVGATAAFAGLLASINSTSGEIDKLAKNASKLGIATGELQKLEFQAGLTGVSTESLNASLQRMVRRVSEAAKGTGEAVKALNELGIDADKLNKLKPEKQFNLIADAMKNVDKQSDRVRLTFSIFGREGINLVNTLNSDLKKSGAEFESLGIKITESQANAVQAFEDAKLKFNLVIKGFMQQLTGELAPAFTALIDKTVEWVKAQGGIAPVARKVADTILSGISSIIGGFNRVLGVVDQISIAINSVRLAYAKFVAFVEKQKFSIFGGDLDFNKLDKVAQLQRDIAKTEERIALRGGATGAIQQSLVGAKSAIAGALPAQKGQLDIKITTDPGVVIERLRKDKEVDKLVQQIIREESAKIGK